MAPPKKRRAVSAETNKHWSEGQRVEAVQAYLIYGKMPQVTAATGIPTQTLHNWKQQQWWRDLEAEMRAADDIALSARLKRIVEKTLDITEDRLEKGDFYYDFKTGELKRKPLNARDVHQIGKDLHNQSRVLDNKPTTTKDVKAEDMLALLAEQFAKFANNIQQKNEKVIEGEVIDALHEERQA